MRIKHIKFGKAIILDTKNDQIFKLGSFAAAFIFSKFILTIKLRNDMLLTNVHLEPMAGFYVEFSLFTHECACTKVMLVCKGHILCVITIHGRTEMLSLLILGGVCITSFSG